MQEHNDDWVELGKTAGAYGVRGWVRIAPYGSGEALVAARKWLVRPAMGEARELSVLGIRPHGNVLVVRFEGIDDKETADALRGIVSVRRRDFPRLRKGEYWLVDLIGCRVENLQGEELGSVSRTDSNGVQDILQVSGEHTYLIPIVSNYVESIDTEHKLIRVDWQRDWF